MARASKKEVKKVDPEDEVEAEEEEEEGEEEEAEEEAEEEVDEEANYSEKEAEAAKPAKPKAVATKKKDSWEGVEDEGAGAEARKAVRVATQTATAFCGICKGSSKDML